MTGTTVGERGPRPTFFLGRRARQTVSTTESQVEAARRAVAPAVTALGLDLYDVEMVGAASVRTLRVTVARRGGVDLDAITAATQAVSPLLDDASGLNGPYLLEV